MEFLSRSTAGGNFSLGATSRCNLVRSLKCKGEKTVKNRYATLAQSDCE